MDDIDNLNSEAIEKVMRWLNILDTGAAVSWLMMFTTVGMGSTDLTPPPSSSWLSCGVVVVCAFW